MSYQIVCADVLDWAAEYEGEKFHAVLCDPPYELAFMNRTWDQSGIPFKSSTWAAIAEHLHPGGFILAFGGSRTYHRLACAVEDAGLIIHSSMVWLQGQGFPKATRIDTQIDKAAGRIGENIVNLKKQLIELMNASGKTRKQIDEECGFRATNYLTLPAEGKRPDPWINVLPSREKWQKIKQVVGCDGALDALFDEVEREVIGNQTKARKTDSGVPLPTTGETEYQTWDITAPATPLAATWAGHRYGLQSLKPCMEVVGTFSKPLTKTELCGIISQTTFLMEVILCTFLPAPDAEEVTNQIHQRLRAVVDNFAHGNADVWELLESVNIAGDPSESSLANSTQQSFVVGPALTRDVTLPLVRTIRTGKGELLSVKDTAISESEADILQNIGSLWKSILGALSNLGSTFTTPMVTSWITDLRTLNYYLSLTIPVYIQSREMTTTGFLSNVLTVADFLSDLLACALKTTIAPDDVTIRPDENDCGISAEFILCAQKPYSGRPVDSIVATGAGALWIDGARVATGEEYQDTARKNDHKFAGVSAYMSAGSNGKKPGFNPNVSGRWPPNVCLSHIASHPCPACDGDGCPDCGGSGWLEGCRRVGTKRVGNGEYRDGAARPRRKSWRQMEGRDLERSPELKGKANAPDNYGTEVVDDWICVEGCPVRALGEMSGESKVPGPYEQQTDSEGGYHKNWYVKGLVTPHYGDTGTAARFYPNHDWRYEIEERLAGVTPFYYCAKSSRRERDQGLDGMMKLRDDLTQEQRQYVLGELERLGIDGA